MRYLYKHIKTFYKILANNLRYEHSKLYFRNDMVQLKPVTHVIFDVDGVIIDSEVLYNKIATNIVANFGKEYPLDLRVKMLGRTSYDNAKLIVEKLNLPISPEEYISLNTAEQRRIMTNVPLMPGAERLIRHLHKNGIPIAVASSSRQSTFELKTAKHKSLINLFHHLVLGSDPEVKHGKPSPDVFLVAERRFENPPGPEQCLVIEDSPNGLKAAKAAGMQVVLVPPSDLPLDPCAKHADLVVPSLLHFKPQMFGLPPFVS